MAAKRIKGKTFENHEQRLFCGDLAACYTALILCFFIALNSFAFLFISSSTS